MIDLVALSVPAVKAEILITLHFQGTGLIFSLVTLTGAAGFHYITVASIGRLFPLKK
jgi:hypothetical protein